MTQEYDCSDRSCNGWKKTSTRPPGRISLAAVAEAIDLQVGNVIIRASGPLDMQDTVQIDGNEVLWIRKATVVLEIGKTPRVILEGPAALREKGDDS